MEKGNLNVIIFDDDEPSIKDHRQSRTVATSKQGAPSSSHHIEVIEQEIQYLTDKIKSLEQQADSLTHIKNESTTNCRQSRNSIDISTDHNKEILMVIEKKIQVIVRETRKIVDKLGETFEKKLQTKLAKKYEQSGIAKLKQGYAASIKKIEEGYKKQIEKMNRDYKEAEGRMVNRVSAIEQKLLNKMNEFTIKEKEYVDWIHHLEIQLRDRQDKQKKRMIQVTHANTSNIIENALKKEQAENSSIMTGENNGEGLQPQKSNSQLNDTSKIQRRHRIFDSIGAKTSSSVSPHQKIVSPISPIGNQPVQSHSSKVINPVSKQPLQPLLTPLSQQPQRQTQVPRQVEKPSLVIDRMTEPLRNNFTNDKESSPWKVMDKSIEKSHAQITKRGKIVKEVNEDEFYKDLPKANQGWQRFQDYKQNEESSSDSEEDVVFYGNEDKVEQHWQSSKDPRWQASGRGSDFLQSKRTAELDGGQQQHVFSPFDLN